MSDFLIKLSNQFSGFEEPQGTSFSGAALVHQRQGAAEDARPQRRDGRAEGRHPLRPLALSQEAQQDRDTSTGQELHPDAGQRPRGDEEAGHLSLSPRGSAAPRASWSCAPRARAPAPSVPSQPRRVRGPYPPLPPPQARLPPSLLPPAAPLLSASLLPPAFLPE